ncbi:MAG: ribosome biogenesis GTPase Der [Candidatus Omnitrophica bacterium]|nr:ribosome biogenesis GTPase Der [Candidatus Omnitrophota bacterium]
MSHIELSKNRAKIAIIGRPNVGKSSLFNRIIKKRKAIVQAVAGVTRDRLYADVKARGAEFILVDTGGILPGASKVMESLVCGQSINAIDESDAVVLVCDVRTGITYPDQHIADLLKKRGAKVFLAVNKADDKISENESYVFMNLGLGQPYIVSVLNNKGIDNLIAGIASFVLSLGKDRRSARGGGDDLSGGLNIALAGKPNVGKSSFINTLLEKQRLIVNDIPGTTRDSVDVSIKRAGGVVTLVDTAGVKHKKKFRDVIEVFSLSRTRAAIKRCNVVFIMIDAAEGLDRDDLSVFDYVIKEGKPSALLVNKSDLIKGFDLQEYKKNLTRKFSPIEWIPVVFTSCKDKKNIEKTLDMARDIYERSKKTIPTAELNKFLVDVQKTNPHVSYMGARPKILYATQISSMPQRFLLFCTKAQLIKKEYLRFIEKRLRSYFGLEAVPISFQLRSRGQKSKDDD